MGSFPETFNDPPVPGIQIVKNGQTKATSYKTDLNLGLLCM